MNHTFRTFTLTFAAALLAACSTPSTDRSASAPRPPVLLAIFAHPDDEASVGPVLAKYANEGARVHLAVATDGRLGVAPHAGILAGPDLAAARERELQCAAERLNLQPPILFGLHDQLRMGEGLETYNEQVAEMRAKVRALFEALKPDVVITWPPSGWSGHPDHRIVSTIVTEVFQSQAWERPTRLYYPAVPTGRLPPSHPMAAAAMDPKYLPVQVQLSADDYAKARAAWLCHKSQYTPEQIEQLYQSLVATQAGVAHFYAIPEAPRSSSLFE